MPIKFSCDHCGKTLRVSSRKAGRRAKCPQCSGAISVPTQDDGDTSTASKVPAADEPESANPLSEFAVYDDEMELVYEQPEADYDDYDDRPVDHNRVSVPRMVLYMQGALLGVVALVFFTFGIICGLGLGNRGGGTVEEVAKCDVTGSVTYENATGETLPDEGAVVMLLPLEGEPDTKPSPDGLRPGEPFPVDDSDALWAIRTIGGDYDHTNLKGEFKLRVDNSRKYYFLCISNRAVPRDTSDRLPMPHRSQIGNYFTSVDELLGDKQYQWQDVAVRGTQKRLADVVFNRTAEE